MSRVLIKRAVVTNANTSADLKQRNKELVSIENRAVLRNEFVIEVTRYIISFCQRIEKFVVCFAKSF